MKYYKINESSHTYIGVSRAGVIKICNQGGYHSITMIGCSGTQSQSLENKFGILAEISADEFKHALDNCTAVMIDILGEHQPDTLQNPAI